MHDALSKNNEVRHKWAGAGIPSFRSLLNWPDSAGEHAPSYHCHRLPPPLHPLLRLQLRCFGFYFAPLCGRKPPTPGKHGRKRRRSGVGRCGRGNSWPLVLVLFRLPLKFKDVIGDALIDIRAPGATPVRGGTRTCAHFEPVAAIKLRWCLRRGSKMIAGCFFHLSSRF